MGNAISNKLVAIKAFIENLFSQNIKLLEGVAFYLRLLYAFGRLNPHGQH
jgi:hypothetical protein